jgi:hypothetical protein
LLEFEQRSLAAMGMQGSLGARGRGLRVDEKWESSRMLNIASGKARERRGRPTMVELTRSAPGHSRHSVSGHREEGERGPARGRGHGEATGHSEVARTRGNGRGRGPNC